MKKTNVLLSIFAFALAVTAAFASTTTVTISGWKAGTCSGNALTIDQASCPGGNTNCTIGGVSPVFASTSDCSAGTPELKYQQ